MRARRTFGRAVRRETRRRWRKMLEEDCEDDPWGKASQLLRGKMKDEMVLVELEKGDGTSTSGVQETVEWMLSKLLPDEGREGEREEHELWRRMAEGGVMVRG